jgi:hypothetical protein
MSANRRLTRTLRRAVFRFASDIGDCRSTVLVAGSGRGGTTWLAEMINFDNRYRFMFEPFYPARVPVSSAFREFQYLRANEDSPGHLAAADAILAGRVQNAWVDTYNRKFRAKERLIKEIRANLFLAWIRRHFRHIPIVLLLRHPFAVAYSRLQENWSAPIEQAFFSQPLLVTDYLEKLPFPAGMSRFERHVFWWCIETLVPLTQLLPEEILVVTYEECIANPVPILRRIFEHIGRPYDTGVLSVLKRPSAEARRNIWSRNISPILVGEDLVCHWTKELDERTIQAGCEILKQFGLHVIYGQDPWPCLSAIHEFMKRNHSPIASPGYAS